MNDVARVLFRAASSGPLRIAARSGGKRRGNRKMTRECQREPGTPGVADLLCYLVVAQLVCHAQTAEWLSDGHLMELSRAWAESSEANCDWLAQVEMGCASARLASRFLVFPIFRNPAALARLFKDAMRLDSRSPVVRGMYDVCKDHIYRGE